MVLAIDALLRRAVQSHKAGNLQSADALYRQILLVQPQHPDANHNLGLIALGVGKLDEAVCLFKNALQADLSQGQFWLSYIGALLKCNQPESARQLLREARQMGLPAQVLDRLTQELDSAAEWEPAPLEANALVHVFAERDYAQAELLAGSMIARYPKSAFGWKALGSALKAMGRNADALMPMQRSIDLMPTDAEGHSNLGVTLRDLGRLSEAEESYRQAIALKPDFAQAHSNLAATLADLGRFAEAVPSYRQAIALKLDFAEVHCSLGNALKNIGQLAEAEASYREAITMKPDFTDAYNNLGVVLRDMGRPVEAEAAYRQVIALKPDFAEVHINLGNVLKDMGRLAEAEASYRQAILMKPDFAQAHGNLGVTLRDLGRLVEAEASYCQAIALKPDFAEARSNLLFALNYAATQPMPDLLEYARAWEVECVPAEARAQARARQFSRQPVAGRRLRVGYVSGDFRQHAVCYFIEQLLAQHDADRVEVFAYSAHFRRDVATARLELLTEHWVSVLGLTDQQLQERIGQDQIDVLIDLSGHTGHNRLGAFARRAAPVQAHWLGYCGSTGLSEMDYWIGDVILTPPQSDHHFCESVWRLPRTWVSYEGKAEAPPCRWQPASDGRICLGSFNNLGKLNAATLALWAQVLHKLPQARLLLKTKGLREQRNRQRIQDVFIGHGVPSERLELQDGSTTTDWATHMAYYDRLDIALDPVGGMGGGTTTCDALWMGVPMVSLVGDRMGSRMTASMLDAVGRSEWLASSTDEYVTKVASLAHDVEGRKLMRASQRASMAASPLCDAKGLARSLEDVYEEMFDKWWQTTGIRSQRC